MRPIRPAKVEAALLYDDYKPFDYLGFARFVQQTFGDQIEVKLGAHEDYSFGVLVIADTYIMVSQNTAPLAPAGFNGALSSHYMGIHYPEAKDIVANHGKNIFVTVGSKDIVITPELENALSELAPELAPKPETPSASLFESYWTTAQIITHLLSIMNPPKLIHWCQSNRFIRPDELAIAVKNGSGWPFQIHPNLFSSGQKTGDQIRIGIMVYGAEHFTGHHMIVEETTFSYDRVIDDILLEMMIQLHGERELPQSGSTIQFKNGAAVKINLQPADKRHPRPYLSLTVEKLADAPVQAEPETPAPRPAPRKSAQTASELPTERKSQIMEAAAGGPKKLIASPVHPNAPAHLTGPTAQTDPVSGPKKHSAGFKNLLTAAAALGLYFGIMEISNLMIGDGATMVSMNSPSIDTDKPGFDAVYPKLTTQNP